MSVVDLIILLRISYYWFFTCGRREILQKTDYCILGNLEILSVIFSCFTKMTHPQPNERRRPALPSTSSSDQDTDDPFLLSFFVDCIMLLLLVFDYPNPQQTTVVTRDQACQTDDDYLAHAERTSTRVSTSQDHSVPNNSGYFSATEVLALAATCFVFVSLWIILYFSF